MQKLVECIPNFSEGNDKTVIDAIKYAITVENVKLLAIDSGKTTNRTVFTFIGEVENVLKSAYNAVKISTQLIDMKKQSGSHPRIGGCDVIPFVPLKNISDKQLIPIVEKFAKKIGEDFNIPIYLYAKSAKKEENRLLPNIRKGGYENFEAKMKNNFFPDFGPNKFNKKTGATVVGVRDLMVAYNVNIDTAKIDNGEALNILNSICKKIRTSGDGKSEGKFRSLQAKVWFLDEFKIFQITTNIHNYKTTPIHAVFEEIKKLAQNFGMQVTGSELIGLIPKQSLIMAGRHYSKLSDDEAHLIETAFKQLNFSDLYDIDFKGKILDI